MKTATSLFLNIARSCELFLSLGIGKGDSIPMRLPTSPEATKKGDARLLIYRNVAMK